MKKETRCRILVPVLALAIASSTNIDASVASAKATSKVTVKVTGVSLREGTVFSKKMAKKAVIITKNGKKTNKFTVSKIGTVIKPKNGKFKFTAKDGKFKKVVSVKVNRIKKIHIKQCKQLPLEEGSTFSSAEIKKFKKKTILMADYKEGGSKKITHYDVIAAKIVKGKKFLIILKAGKAKTKISIPVIKKGETVVPTAEPTTEPSAEPSMNPTEKPTNPPSDSTAEPTNSPSNSTAEPSTNPPSDSTAKPTNSPSNSTAEPSTNPPSDSTAKPTNPPSDSTAKPTTTPSKFLNLTIDRKGEGTVTVNNQLCDFSKGNTVTEKITKGDVALTAGNTKQFKFSHWMNTDTKEVLSKEPIWSTKFDKDTKVTAVFERVYTFTVKRDGGKGKVTWDGKELEFYNNVATSSTIAKRCKFEATSTDDYVFVKWVDKNGKLLSNNPTLNISVATDTVELTAIFTPAEKTVNVTYQHESGQLLLSEAVAFGGTLAPPTEGTWMGDKTLAGWKIGDTVYAGSATDKEFYDKNGNSLSDAIKSLTSQKKNVTIVSYYTANLVKYHNVTINGASITIKGNGEITDIGIKDGSLIHIEANVPFGKFFSHYEDTVTHEKISFNAIMDLYVTGDISWKAVFVDNPVVKEPVVHFTGAKYELYPADYGVRFYMGLELPNEYERIEWGLLYTGQELTEETMIAGSGSVATILNSSSSLGSGDWIYNLAFHPSIWEAGSTVRVRSYAIVKNADGSKTIYSEIISIKLASE